MNESIEVIQSNQSVDEKKIETAKREREGPTNEERSAAFPNPSRSPVSKFPSFLAHGQLGSSAANWTQLDSTRLNDPSFITPIDQQIINTNNHRANH